MAWPAQVLHRKYGKLKNASPEINQAELESWRVQHISAGTQITFGEFYPMNLPDESGQHQVFIAFGLGACSVTPPQKVIFWFIEHKLEYGHFLKVDGAVDPI